MSKRVLFCRVSYMKYYKGITKEDRPIGGGKWVELNGDCGEKYNFLPHHNLIHGFFEPGRNQGTENQVQIQKIDHDCNQADYIENVTVVFCSKPLNMPMVIVGWYKNATVYRKIQKAEYFGRNFQFNILANSNNAYLLSEDQRILEVPTGKGGFGEKNYWYADQNSQYVEQVLEYIAGTERNTQKSIEAEIDYLDSIYANPEIDKTERDIIAKERIGQGAFRRQLIARDGCCRICGIRNQKLLVASHIKPWSKCTNAERLDADNGLLLCAMHDALFDNGLISFDQDGRIFFSVQLSDEDISKMNISKSCTIEMSDKMKKYMKYHLETWKNQSDYIRHSRYGEGKIIKRDYDYVIMFDNDFAEGGSLKKRIVPRDSSQLEFLF